MGLPRGWPCGEAVNAAALGDNLRGSALHGTSARCCPRALHDVHAHAIGRAVDVAHAQLAQLAHTQAQRIGPRVCSIMGSSIDCSEPEPEPVTSAATMTWWLASTAACAA